MLPRISIISSIVLLLSLSYASAAIATPASCSILTPTTTLRPGTTSPKVQELQRALNQDPSTQVTTTGAGSPGKETTKYGPATFLAVKHFQEKYKDDILTPNGLTRGTGFFGPSTKKKMYSLYCTETAPVSTPTPAPSPSTWEGTPSPTPSPSIPSGSITLSATSCTIATGASVCTIPVSWSIINPGTPSVRQNSTQFSTLSTGSSVPRVLSYGINTFTLSDGSLALDTKTATASCVAGTSWSGGVCAVIVPVSIVPSWATSATYYVDPAGDDANTGLSSSTPKRTLSNHINMNGVTVLLKRGSTIELTTHLYPKNTYIGSYGPSTSKPIVVVADGSTWAIGVDSGQFEIHGIVLPGNAALKASTQPGVGATKASQVTVEDCDIQSYSTGIAFAGTGSVIRNNRISNMRKNGIVGGSSSFGAAPSESLVIGNYINMEGSTDDGITFHDGTGWGRGNRIIGNTIVGTNVENSIDLQGQFVDTLIEDNTMDGAATYSIVIDDPMPGAVELVGTIIRRNRISNINDKRAAIYTRIPNVLISENLIFNSTSTLGGPAIVVEASARVLNNTIHVPASSTRSVFTIVQKTGVSAFGGEIRGNKVDNYSSQGFITISATDTQAILDRWAIDENKYRAPSVSSPLFVGMDFNQWTSIGNGSLRTNKDVRSTLESISPSPAPTPSGSITLTTTSCTIATGASTCTIPVSWSISNPVSPSVRQNSTQFSTSPTGSSTPRSLSYGTSTFILLDGSTTLDSKTANALCVAGTAWNGSVCATIPPIVSSPYLRHMYVDQSTGNDTNSGTIASPYKTISKAVSLMKVGDEIIIGPGIYREIVTVPTLTSTSQVSLIRSLTPGTVIIKGSSIYGGWVSEGAGIWSLPWPVKEAEQVYVNGTQLLQVGGTAFGAAGGTLPSCSCAYWPGRIAGDKTLLTSSSTLTNAFAYDATDKKIYIKPASPITGSDVVEVSDKRNILKAVGVSYLTIDGINFEHANSSAYNREGAVYFSGNFNTIKNSTVKYADSAGVSMSGNDNRLENSTITDSGQVGLFADGYRITIINNQFLRNNTRGFSKNWEAGGMKLVGGPHVNDSFITNNTVAYNYGDGIWFDWMNNNNVIDSNVTAYNSGHGIHYEVSQRGIIRNNISYGNRQRGIFAPGTSDTVIEKNSVFSNGMEGIVVINDDRSATYPLFVPFRNTFSSNSMAWNDKINYIQLIVPGTTYNNSSDKNVFKAYAVSPRMSLGWMSETPTRSWTGDLPTWRTKSEGMDMNSVSYTEAISPEVQTHINNKTIIPKATLPEFLQTPGN